MPKVKEFRGVIYSKFDSESEFARAMNWNKQRLNRITNGLKQPDLGEIDEMAATLGVKMEELIAIFLAYKSTIARQN